MACNLGEKELKAVGVALDIARSTKRGLGECMMLAVRVRGRTPDNSRAPALLWLAAGVRPAVYSRLGYRR